MKNLSVVIYSWISKARILKKDFLKLELSMKLLISQLDVSDKETAVSRINKVFNILRNAPRDVFVVLPELWVSGAFSKTAYSEEAFEENSNFLRQLVQSNILTQGVLGTFLTKNIENQLCNTLVTVLDTGKYLKYDKIHTFGFESEEARLIHPGNIDISTSISGYSVGFCICYDIRFPELIRKMTYNGIEVLVVSASWPRVRIDHWKKLLVARAIENQLYVIGVNAVGQQNGKILGGHSMIISPNGEVVTELSDFEELYEMEIDLSLVRSTRESFPVLNDIRILSIE